MPPYHSAFNAADFPTVCGMAVLPLKGRGGAPADEEDQIDEALRLFRANALFRNFEVLGAGDRTLLYLLLLIQQFLKKCEGCTAKAEALAVLAPLAAGSHILPSDPGWPLTGTITAPRDAAEAEALKSFLKQLREGLASRLVDKVFNGSQPPKFWLSFSKRKVLNKEFV